MSVSRLGLEDLLGLKDMQGEIRVNKMSWGGPRQVGWSAKTAGVVQKNTLCGRPNASLNTKTAVRT